MICGAVSKVFLLLFYLFQTEMQSGHDYFYNNNNFGFKLIAYLIRMSYAFVLCFVYVLQYRSYWDTYNYFTDCVADYKYFFGLAIVCILAYRYMLEGDFSSYSKTVPFELTIDDNHKTFFLQGTFVKLKNVRILCNHNKSLSNNYSFKLKKEMASKNSKLFLFRMARNADRNICVERHL